MLVELLVHSSLNSYSCAAVNLKNITMMWPGQCYLDGDMFSLYLKKNSVYIT